MLGLFYRFDLGYDDGCSSVKSVGNGSVVMARDPVHFVSTSYSMLTTGVNRT